MTPAERNVIHNGKPLKGKKNGVLSKDISVEGVKKQAKLMNATINDVIMALTSITLKEYMVSKGDTKTSTINLAVPYSLRELPKKKEDFELKNDFAMMKIPLDLTDNFQDSLSKVKTRMNALKNSIEPYGMYYFLKVALFLPNLILKHANNFLCDKMSIVFSNVPGPKVPWVINGAKSRKTFFFVPGLANIASGISVMSHVDIFKIGV
jgi:diacylglycerol O-acyltransferase